MRAGWLLLSPADSPPPEPAWLAPAERRHLAALHLAPRRADWRHGRWAAKRALAAWLGWAASPEAWPRLAVVADERGVPRAWLDGEALALPISISHRAGHALVAVADEGVLGCDLELVEPRSDAFVRDYFTAAEQRLTETAGGERHLVANLVWACKEAALKALGDGLRRDTREVEIDLDRTAANGQWQRFSAAVAGTAPLAGTWRQEGPLLLALLGVPSVGELGPLS